MVSVVLLMAGKGSRMNVNINKIRLQLGDCLIYEHSLNKFLKYGFQIVCVLSKEDEDLVSKLPVGVDYTFGGETRQQSVKNGLAMCKGNYVLIHDAARPLLATSVIDEILKLMDDKTAVLAYHKVTDTIKMVVDNKLKTLPRNSLIAATTPQCAPLRVFLDVFAKAEKDNYEGTDDISLIEKYAADIKIELVLANDENFKITTKADYEFAKSILEMKK